MRLVEGSQAVFCGEPGDVPLVRAARHVHEVLQLVVDHSLDVAVLVGVDQRHDERYSMPSALTEERYLAVGRQVVPNGGQRDHDRLERVDAVRRIAHRLRESVDREIAVAVVFARYGRPETNHHVVLLLTVVPLNCSECYGSGCRGSSTSPMRARIRRWDTHWSRTFRSAR